MRIYERYLIWAVANVHWWVYGDTVTPEYNDLWWSDYGGDAG
jgi:hypothetical protein